jgi:hypothetical protein
LGKIYSVTRCAGTPTVPATEFVSVGNAAHAMQGIFSGPIICVTRLVEPISTVMVTVHVSMGNVSVVIQDTISEKIYSVTNYKPGAGVTRADPIVTAHFLGNNCSVEIHDKMHIKRSWGLPPPHARGIPRLR